MEEKERNTTGWRVCREKVKQPVAELACKRATRDGYRQHVNRRKWLGRRKRRARSDRRLKRSYTLVVTACTVTIGFVTLELHSAAAGGRLHLCRRTAAAQKKGRKGR